MSTMPGGPVLDPAILASLANTMGPAGILTQMEAERSRAAKEAAAGRQAAVQQATQAGQAYQSAAAAPPPELSPQDQFIPTLLGNLASVIGQDPSYKQNAQGQLREQRKNLMQTRLDNLTALRDNFSKAAAAADEAGDLETSLKHRSKMETLSKTMEVLLANQGHQQGLEKEERKRKADIDLERERQKGDVELQRMRDKTAREVAGIRSGGGPGGENMGTEAWLNLVETGQAKLSDIVEGKTKQRTAVVKLAAERGSTVLSPKVRETVNQLSAARGILDQIKALSASVNVAGEGIGRFAEGAKSAARGFLQTNIDDAVYDTTREGFLATISRATGERGVLTDRDALRAKQLLPKRSDSRETAQYKLHQLEQFLNGMEARAIRAHTTKAADLVGAPASGKAADPLGIR